jgi:hypothetical protein
VCGANYNSAGIIEKLTVVPVQLYGHMGAAIQKTPDRIINPHNKGSSFLIVVQNLEAITCTTFFKITGLTYLNLLHGRLS